MTNIFGTVNKEKYRILSTFLQGADCLIHPLYVYGMLPYIKAVLAGDSSLLEIPTEVREPEKCIVALNGSLQPLAGSTFEDAPSGSIAIIPVKDSLVKEDDYWGIGMRTIGQLVREAKNNPNIIGTVIIHESPGGTVNGVEDCSNEVAAHRDVKPIVSFIDYMSASGSYWIASPSNHIILSGKTAGSGSIGVMMSYLDITGIFEEMGAKFHDIVADQSPEKNKDFRDMLEGKYESIKKGLLNPHAQTFIDFVKTYRPNLPKEATEGGYFIGQKSIDMGLVDSFGTIDMAIKKVQELAESSTNSNTQPSNKSQNSDMFSSKLDKAVKHLADKVKADGGYENVTLEDHIDPVNQELANLGLDSLVVASKKGISDIEAERDAALQAQKKAETERDEAKAEAAKLAKKPGATHTDPAVKKDNDGGDAKTDPKVVKESEEFASYEHNIAALKEIENL